MVANRRIILWTFVAFVAGIAVAVFVGARLNAIASRSVFPMQYREVGRAVSPDGVVEAVLVETDCGVPCSVGCAVRIVPKGMKASTGLPEPVFLAQYIVNPRIRWLEPHLLEVAFDKALINSFRNIEYPLAHSGEKGSFRYMVEIRLAPSSPRFSYLDDRTGSAP